MIRGVAKLRMERTCDVSLKVVHCGPRLVPSNSSTKHSVVGAGEAEGAGVIVGALVAKLPSHMKPLLREGISHLVDIHPILSFHETSNAQNPRK